MGRTRIIRQASHLGGAISATPGSGLLRPLNGDSRSAISDGLDDLAAEKLSVDMMNEGAAD